MSGEFSNWIKRNEDDARADDFCVRPEIRPRRNQIKLHEKQNNNLRRESFFPPQLLCERVLITPARDVTQQVPSRRIGSRPVSRQAADSIKRIKAPGARARTKGFYFASFLLFWPTTRSIALDSPGAKKKKQKRANGEQQDKGPGLKAMMEEDDDDDGGLSITK